MKKLMMLVLILALALCSVPAALAEGDTPDALADWALLLADPERAEAIEGALKR